MGTDRDQERNEIFSIKQKVAESSLPSILGDEQLVRFRSTSKHYKSFNSLLLSFLCGEKKLMGFQIEKVLSLDKKKMIKSYHNQRCS